MPGFCCSELELRNWFVMFDVVEDGVDNASDTVFWSLTPFKNCVSSGDKDRDASLSLILARSLSTFFNIRFTLLACLLLLLFVSLLSGNLLLSKSSWSWINSPIPTSEEEAEIVKGLLAGSDKYSSFPGMPPVLLTYHPLPLRTSPPNRPSVPMAAYFNNELGNFGSEIITLQL